MKITVFEGPYMTASNYYRDAGVFRYMDEVEVSMVGPQLDPRILMSTKVLWISRPLSIEQIKVMEDAYTLGIPIIIDYDDPLDAIPVFNKAHNPGNKELVSRALALATKVIVSTPGLQEHFKTSYNMDSIVIRNAIKIPNVKVNPIKVRGKKKILFRGSDSHQRDLITIAASLIDAQHKNDLELHFAGTIPPFLDNFILHGTKKLFDYLKWMRTFNPSFLIFPLEDIAFNKCKSNISQLEALFLSNTMVWSNYNKGEFSNGGICNDMTFEELISFSNDDLNNVIDLKVKASLEYAQKYCNMEIENEKRIQIIKDIY